MFPTVWSRRTGTGRLTAFEAPDSVRHEHIRAAGKHLLARDRPHRSDFASLTVGRRLHRPLSGSPVTRFQGNRPVTMRGRPAKTAPSTPSWRRLEGRMRGRALRIDVEGTSRIADHREMPARASAPARMRLCVRHYFARSSGRPGTSSEGDIEQQDPAQITRGFLGLGWSPSLGR
jgi:hypothetical protein